MDTLGDLIDFAFGALAFVAAACGIVMVLAATVLALVMIVRLIRH